MICDVSSSLTEVADEETRVQRQGHGGLEAPAPNYLL